MTVSETASPAPPQRYPRRPAPGSAPRTPPLLRPLLCVVPGDARRRLPPVVLRDSVPSLARCARLAAVLKARPLLAVASDAAPAAVVVLPLGVAGAHRPDVWADFDADDADHFELAVELVALPDTVKPDTDVTAAVQGDVAILLGHGHATSISFADKHGIWTCPILNDEGTCIAELACEYLIVLPFLRQDMEQSARSFAARPRSTEPVPSIAGHRGLGSSRTCAVLENTLLSFTAATSSGEVNHIELDVQLTRDSVPVIYHDWAYPIGQPKLAKGGAPSKLFIYDLTAEQFSNLPPAAPPPLLPPLADHEAATFARNHPSQIGSGRSIANGDSFRKKVPRAKSVPSAIKSDKDNTHDARVLLHDKFPTLAEVSENLSPDIGLFVEIKYPPSNVQARDGIPYPEKNHLVDRVLHCLFSETGTQNAVRSLRFLSFDADICMMLALKQTAVPVYFLHCEQADGLSCDDADPRTTLIDNGIEFAVSQGLYGMVLFAPMILADESLGCRIRKDHNLSLMTYGRENRTREFVLRQYARGVECVIADEVLRVAREVRRA